jgi:hypothetical protein
MFGGKGVKASNMSNKLIVAPFSGFCFWSQFCNSEKYDTSIKTNPRKTLKYMIGRKVMLPITC